MKKSFQKTLIGRIELKKSKIAIYPRKSFCSC